MYRRILFIAVFSTIWIAAKAFPKDQDSLYLNKKCPDFRLTNVVNFPKKDVSLSDFRGKWLVLDFWSEDCTSCIRSFPETDKLQKRFKDSVQFLLIGYTGSQSDKSIRKLFKKVTGDRNWNFAYGFDSTLFHRFGITGVPHLLFIDPSGILRGASNSQVDPGQISMLLKGSNVTLNRNYTLSGLDNNKHASYKFTHPFLINNNGGPDTAYLSRSLFADWDIMLGPHFNTQITKNNRHGIEMIGCPLDCMYFEAYFGFNSWSANDSIYGKVYPKLLLRLADSSQFIPNYGTGKNVFCYSMSTPHRTLAVGDVMGIFQADLHNTFGYKVVIEKWPMPCFRLVDLGGAKAKLSTNGNGQPWIESDNDKIIVRNRLMKDFWATLAHVVNGLPSLIGDYPVIDDTKITGKVNISIEADMENFDEIKAALRKNNLDLIKSTKVMDVLVIEGK